MNHKVKQIVEMRFVFRFHWVIEYYIEIFRLYQPRMEMFL